MGVAPDVMFQLALSVPLDQDAIAGIAGAVQASVFTGSVLDYLRKENIPLLPPQTSYTGGVVSVGLWLGAEQRPDGKWTADGFTDAQRLQALIGAGFISGGDTAGFLFSQAMMQFSGRAQLTAKPTSGVKPDSLKVTLNSSTDIVTVVQGSYSVPVLPDIDYTYTVHESLRLNPQGSSPAMASRLVSRNLDVSQLDIIADSILIGLVESGLGGIALIGGEIKAGTEDPNKPGVASSLADDWPTDSLTSKPIAGKITFLWTDLTVSASAVRTRGHLQLGFRQPQVKILGPTAVSFRQTQPGVSETYSLALTDLRPENATVVWGGEAAGSGLQTSVRFDVAGSFRITATVTDTDNVTATGTTTVFVNVIKTGGGRTGETP
ncbi:MAG TPA: hypothetical protein VH855_15770 [Acetobacteraceae bacterium]